MMKDAVSDVGARVGKYYREKPWVFPYKWWNLGRTIEEGDEYFKHKHQATIAWDRVHPNRTGAYMIAKAFLKKCDFNFE